MTNERSATENAYIARAVEASINIGLVALLAAVCLLILAPFVPIVAWGIIIAVASYPVFLKLQHANGTWRLGSRYLDHSPAGRADHPGCSAGQQHGGGRPKFNGATWTQERSAFRLLRRTSKVGLLLVLL